MALPDVSTGDPHPEAHNDERHAINDLETTVGDLQVKALPLIGYDALASFRTALSNRDSARVDILKIGDSGVEGFPASTFDRSEPQQTAARLRSRFPTAGLGSKGGRGYIGVPTQGPNPAIVQPVVYTSGTFNPASQAGPESFNLGVNRNVWYSTNATPDAQKVVLTTRTDATSVRIHHARGPSGIADGAYYKINGGAKVLFTTYDAVGVAAVETVVMPAGGGTLEVGCNVNGKFFIFTGFEEFSGDENKGIVVHNAGHSGYTAARWAAAPTTAAGWRFAMANINPDLLCISLGPNDANTAGAGRTAAQFKTDLVALIAAIRGGPAPLPTVPILLEAKYDMAGGINFAEGWKKYVDAMKSISGEDPTVAFLDYSDKMYPTTAADTWDLYHTDKVHGNANGRAYAEMAKILVNALVPA